MLLGVFWTWHKSFPWLFKLNLLVNHHSANKQSYVRKSNLLSKRTHTLTSVSVASVEWYTAWAIVVFNLYPSIVICIQSVEPRVITWWGSLVVHSIACEFNLSCVPCVIDFLYSWLLGKPTMCHPKYATSRAYFPLCGAVNHIDFYWSEMERVLAKAKQVGWEYKTAQTTETGERRQHCGADFNWGQPRGEVAFLSSSTFVLFYIFCHA